MVARDTGLAPASAEVVVIAEATRRFVGRMVEVMHTGNGSVTVEVARKKIKRVDWNQSEFAF